MSTHALKTSDRVGGNAPPSAPAPAGDQPATDSLGLKLLRNLDFLVLLLVLPVFILADLPLAGYATAAGAWIVQRVIQTLVNKKAHASNDPRTVAGLSAGSMLARGWLVAGAIFVVGLSDEDAGLAAAVLFLAIFSVWFSLQMVLRPFSDPKRAAR